MKGRKQSDREDSVGETRFIRTGIDRARPSAECRWLVCGEGAGEEEEEEEGRGLCGMNCVGRGFSQNLTEPVPQGQSWVYEQKWAGVQESRAEPIFNEDSKIIFPSGCGDASGEEPACQVGRSPGGGNGNPLHLLAWGVPRTEEPGGLHPWGRTELDPAEAA